jgi:L-arabinose isomerase
MHTRMRIERTVVVGHWQDGEVHRQLGVWMRAALGWHDLQGARIVRFGDNMRNVAVTDGDKVAAEIRFGFTTLSHGVTELVAAVAAISDAEADRLCAEYEASYTMHADLRRGGARHALVHEQARIELGLRAFLKQTGAKGFTTNFEDLGALVQLPGLAVQRLMADGYGFGAEGDWKTCALLRAMKTMATGLPGGTSWMEDYTYHLESGKELVLGAHMLEVCPSIAAAKPVLDVHPLGIGGKADPARLVFDAKAGPAINASLTDLGNRFRLIVNEVDAVQPPALPNLPVARAVWTAKPDFKTSAACWIHAGGAHHAAFSQSLTVEHLRAFAAMAGIECAVIGTGTTVEPFVQSLRWNELYYHLAQGLSRV